MEAWTDINICILFLFHGFKHLLTLFPVLLGGREGAEVYKLHVRAARLEAVDRGTQGRRHDCKSAERHDFS